MRHFTTCVAGFVYAQRERINKLLFFRRLCDQPCVRASRGNTVRPVIFEARSPSNCLAFSCRGHLDFLNSQRLVKRLDREMAFTSLKLKSASGANRIKSADEAYSFMMHMRLSDQNKPHWQMARQALNNAAASDDCEIQAWRSFRAAAAAEGWLLD